MSVSQIYRGLPPKSEKSPCAVAIGNFDGVHLGHQALLKSVARIAKERSITSAVVTFEPHPSEFFATRTLERISTMRDRYEAILACGIERIYMIPFTKELASLTPEQFAKTILVDGIGAEFVTVGENFRFGMNASGNSQTLIELGEKLHFEVKPNHLVTESQVPVSSSRVREAMLAGDIEKVQKLLGRPYTVTGRVIHGAALGRHLGYPTLNINILPPGSPAKPALRGVYAVKIHRLEDNKVLFGVGSLGVKPTTVTQGARWLLETNVFDWSGDAYGKIVAIEFVTKLRDEKKFSGLSELTEAIRRDACRARELFGL